MGIAKDRLREHHPILEKIVSGAMIIPEIAFIAIDIFQIPIRDRIIPRSVKSRFPWLSCRRYDINNEVYCSPAEKYFNDCLFQCRYYEYGKCTKHKKIVEF